MKRLYSLAGPRTGLLALTILLVAGAFAPGTARAADGVAGWGANKDGQLGDNSTAGRNYPGEADMTGVLAGKKVIQVAAGGDHSLALTSDGRVYSWGDNSAGQLGTRGSADSLVPAAVRTDGALNDQTVIAIAAGAAHSLALTSDGRVIAWGQNANGQLGSNTTTSSGIPTQIVQSASLGRRSIVAIAAGARHSVAIANDGRVYGWGDNSMGQLGDGTFTSRLTAFSAAMDGALEGKSLTSIAAGDSHTLVLSSEGQVFSWGRNTEGQLGDGTNNNSNVPVAVSTANGALVGGVRAIDAGAHHSLARAYLSECAAWGDNSRGQLGTGGSGNSNVPVKVAQTLLKRGMVRSISAGGNHNLVYATDGKMYSWGDDSSGQLDASTLSSSSVPVGVTMNGALANKVIGSYSAGGRHTLAVATIPVAAPGPAQNIVNSTALAQGGVGLGWEVPVDTGGQLVFRSETYSPAQSTGSLTTGYVLRPDTTDPAIKYESGFANGKYWYQYTVIGAGAGAGYFQTTLDNGSPDGMMTQVISVSNAVNLAASASSFNYETGDSPVFRGTLNENGTPILGANVNVRFNDMEIPFRAMHDDGASGDGAANDGVYGTIAPPIKKGTFTATITANGTNEAGEPFMRQSLVLFTVGLDTVPPTVTVTSPANNSLVR